MRSEVESQFPEKGDCKRNKATHVAQAFSFERGSGETFLFVDREMKAQWKNKAMREASRVCVCRSSANRR